MRFFDEIDAEPPELNDFSFGKQPTKHYPMFSYAFIKVDNSTYSFLNAKCELKDYQRYFKAVQKVSSETIEEWINKPHNKSHKFKLETSSKNHTILQLLKEISGKKDLNTIEDIPNIGHFHLSAKENATEKPTVVHFILGARGQFFIIAFDLFHEIHKTNS
jgi:hypothetical protein